MSALRVVDARQVRIGYTGSVGELIRVPAELDLAIEPALGGAVQNIVTLSDREAEQAIAYLKQSKSGRATFLLSSFIAVSEP